MRTRFDLEHTKMSEKLYLGWNKLWIFIQIIYQWLMKIINGMLTSVQMMPNWMRYKNRWEQRNYKDSENWKLWGEINKIVLQMGDKHRVNAFKNIIQMFSNTGAWNVDGLCSGIKINYKLNSSPGTFTRQVYFYCNFQFFNTWKWAGGTCS